MTTAPGPAAALDRIIVLAPYRKDADYLCQLLSANEMEVQSCSGAEALAEHLETAGVLVATHEALTPPIIAVVAEHLHAQPPWSEMPIVVLLDRASRAGKVADDLGKSWPRSRQLFYQRPVTSMELLSGIQSALLARLRQREVRDYIARETELRRELNHRVKNILASVSSIFEMTRRGAGSIEGLTEDFRGRLGALGNVHSAVFEAEGDHVDLGEIAALTFRPYFSEDNAAIIAQGPPIAISRDAATTMALCLHELTTNAIKYGALSRPDGKVHFTWKLDGGSPEKLEIDWRETGGPIVAEPSRIGYGTRYLRAALSGVFGETPDISFAPEGLRCRVSGQLYRLVGNQ
jgi:two-component sensor histidine kinase